MPQPTQPQLEYVMMFRIISSTLTLHCSYQDDEIGVIIHYNMATQAGSQGCSSSASPPDIKTFAAPADNITEQWADAMVALGAKVRRETSAHRHGGFFLTHACSMLCTWPNMGVDLPHGHLKLASPMAKCTPIPSPTHQLPAVTS